MLIVLSTVLIEMKRGRVLGQKVPSYSEDTQIIASVCSLIKSLLEMASLSRSLKVHNMLKVLK